MPKPRLITLPFSHYCEKARWALDYAGVNYVEEKHLPGAHLPAKLLARARTLPVLVTPHGTLRDSVDILLFADRQSGGALYPRDGKARAKLDELEALFNHELGKAARVFAYHHGLSRLPALLAMVAPGLSGPQRALFPVVMPLMSKLIRARYQIDEASAARAEDTIARIFDRVGAVLERQRFLSGDAFGAADLTFAALSAPLVFPPNHPAHPSDVSAAPPAIRAHVEQLRETLAGKHAVDTYREYRTVTAKAVGARADLA